MNPDPALASDPLVPATRRCRIVSVTGREPTAREDHVIAEEPLAIRFTTPAQITTRDWMVAMWTPGNGEAFLAGLLFAEGVIQTPAELLAIHWDSPNAVTITLRELPDLSARHTSNAACGACGKNDLRALGLADITPLPPQFPKFPVDPRQLPAAFNARLPQFAQTGGNHAAALVAPTGDLHPPMEDVGRHNAVDKAIGAALLQGNLPADHALLVSSRLGFEIVQKAARARLGLVLAMGAASSLAVELADRTNITLVGFLSPERYNIYTHPQRLTPASLKP